MSHDRGCYCGREKWEYHECTMSDCPKKDLYGTKHALKAAKKDHEPSGNVYDSKGNKMPFPSMAYTGKWYMGKLQEDNWGREYITIGPYEMEDHSEDTICEVTGENSGDPEDQARLIITAVNHYLGLDK